MPTVIDGISGVDNISVQADLSRRGGVIRASNAEMIAGTDTVKYATANGVREAINANTNLTPVNVFASRAIGVTYTNTETYDIYVAASTIAAGGADFIIVGGVAASVSSSPATWLNPLFARVKAGATYRITGVSSTLNSWIEYKRV